MPITKPTTNAIDYLDEDSEDSLPRFGTTVQSGWDAADTILKSDNEFPTDFKFAEDAKLVKFLQAEPFMVYQQHWIERGKGKKSFVCLEEDCPLCDILGDKPRGRFAFNVLSLSGDMTVEILTAPPSLFRLLRKAHTDERKGPLNKEYWAVSRIGTGPKTAYVLDFVRGKDLEEEWSLDQKAVEKAVAEAQPLGVEAVRVSSRADMEDVAKEMAV